MKIVIGTSPMDVKLLDNKGEPLGVHVVSLKVELSAQELPMAHFSVELWGDGGNEIILDGVELDKHGFIRSQTRDRLDPS